MRSEREITYWGNFSGSQHTQMEAAVRGYHLAYLCLGCAEGDKLGPGSQMKAAKQESAPGC